MFIGSTRLVGYQQIQKKYSFIKKLTIGAAIAASFTFGVQSASAEETLSTVYHIYVGEEHIGTVDNQGLIDELIDSKITEKQPSYEHLNLTVEDIEVLPEKMFHPVFDNKEAIEKLEKELDVVVDSAELVIGGQSVASFSSNEDAEAVLKAYKLQYVSEDLLNELDTRQKANIPMGPLLEGDSRIIDISFSEAVALEKNRVHPDKILSVDQGINLLKKGQKKEQIYKVQERDVLGGIASKHDLSLKDLLNLNPEMSEDSLIKPGDELNVTVLKPFFDVIVKHEVSKKEHISYETEIKEDSSIPKGEQKITQDGQNGERLANYLIYKENGKEVKRETVSEKVIKEPVKEQIIKGTKVIPSRGSGKLSWPAVDGYISSGLGQRWGKLHKGIDIARPSDRTIKAADNGKVESAGFNGGYGNKVVINHNNGLKTIYAHLDSISVSVGQVVSQGQKIGVMGTTGNSTGVHLHFEVYDNGNLENPMDYLK